MSPSESALGLTRVDTPALKTLLQALYRGTLPCPLTPVNLACHGLQDPSEWILRHLRGLDRAAVRAVVVAVLAERMTA